MAEITFKGNPIHTAGELPPVGVAAPAFSIRGQNLQDFGLGDHAGKKKILNIFPSLDTGICALSVKAFHGKAAERDDVVVINISADLPFAQKRFCGAEGVSNAITGSTFASSFAADYGVTMLDGPLKDLCSRCVVVLDANDQVVYAEQVPEIVQEPNYDAALAALD